jgi:hypothetical protein
MIGLGIWLIVDPTVTNFVGLTLDDTNSDLLRNAAIVIITVGCVLFLVTFLGFIGAILEHRVVLGIVSNEQRCSSSYLYSIIFIYLLIYHIYVHLR